MLAGQGWGAWPVCSRKAGATGQPATQRSAPAARLAAPAKPAPKPAAAPANPAQAPRPATVAAPANPGPAAQAPRPATVGEYVVQRGDTLSAIAARQHIAGGWRALAAKNPGLANPNVIHAGLHLTV